MSRLTRSRFDAPRRSGRSSLAPGGGGREIGATGAAWYRARDPKRFPDLSRLDTRSFTADWTLPPEVEEYLDIHEAVYGPDCDDGDPRFQQLDALWARIFNPPPRRLGDVLARAVIMDVHLRGQSGAWDDGTVWTEGVVLSVLQFAGLTDGKLQRGEAADAY